MAPGDPGPKALACDGPLVGAGDAPAAMRVRFVDGRPLRLVTQAFLTRCGDRLARTGVTTRALVWDNAAWYASRAIRPWLGEHNRRVHRAGGVRSIPCWLPTKRPWLNPTEPKWVHAKRRVVEPARLLTARELEDRVCAAFACPLAAHLSIPQEVA